MPDPIAVPGKIDEVAKYLNGGDAVFEYLTDTDKSTMVKALNRLRTIGEVENCRLSNVLNTINYLPSNLADFVV